MIIFKLNQHVYCQLYILYGRPSASGTARKFEEKKFEARKFEGTDTGEKRENTLKFKTLLLIIVLADDYIQTKSTCILSIVYILGINYKIKTDVNLFYLKTSIDVHVD